ncbi:MAG: hypothetical protein WCI30_09450, partial [Clostridia bacterium]
MMFKKIKADYKAVLSRDPAARNGLEVILLYSGFHALLIHRFAHVLYNYTMQDIASSFLLKNFLEIC